MSPTYKQNKTHIYKYRENNYERVLNINKKYKQKYDAWKKIQKVFLRILL